MGSPKKTQFTKHFEEKIKKTIVNYNLISKKDRVLAACSGGKDSTTTLHLVKKLGFDVKAITVDLGIGDYSNKNLDNLIVFCKENQIKLTKIYFNKEFGHSLCFLRDVLKSKGIKLKSCSVCGVLRRHLLNKKARELKATKIVTGHNMDDECQAVLMNFFRNTLEKSARLGPISGLVKDKAFVPRVKPLYFCLERDVEKYSKLMDFPVLYQKCPCSYDAFRNQVRNLLNKYETKEPKLKQNIINSFLKTSPKLKEHYKTNEKLNYCDKCGEIAKGKICRSCEIIDKLKS